MHRSALCRVESVCTWQTINRVRKEAPVFISLEGFECCGKSTAATYICERLTELGVDHTRSREPGGTPVAEDLRSLLLLQAVNMGPDTESMLFYASRIEHTARLIRPALEHGQVVICDRYFDSTLAYQGALGSTFSQDLHNFMVESGSVAIPDITILFDVDYETFAHRKHSRGTVVGEEINTFEDLRDADYHRAVINRFRVLAMEYPERFLVINANKKIADVKESVLHIINRVIEDDYFRIEINSSDER